MALDLTVNPIQVIMAQFAADIQGGITQDKINSAVQNAETAITALNKIVEQLAPVAQAMAPLAGTYAPAVAGGASAANAIALAGDKLIAAHDAGDKSPQTFISLLAGFAKDIAPSLTAFGVKSSDAAKVTEIATTVAQTQG